MKIYSFFTFGSLLLLFAHHALAKEGVPPRYVAVSGECLRSVAQDRASIVVTVEIKDKDPGVATQKATAQYNQILELVKRLNLKDAELTTNEFSVNEVIDYQTNKRISQGFSARMGLRTETADMTRIGEIVQIAGKLGLHEITGLSSFVSKEKLKLERESCLEEALKSAKAKAEKMVHTAGARLGSVLSIQEEGARSPGPVFSADMASMTFGRSEKGTAPPQMLSGKSDLTVSVSVSYSIE